MKKFISTRRITFCHLSLYNSFQSKDCWSDFCASLFVIAQKLLLRCCSSSVRVCFHQPSLIRDYSYSKRLRLRTRLIPSSVFISPRSAFRYAINFASYTRILQKFYSNSFSPVYTMSIVATTTIPPAVCPETVVAQFSTGRKSSWDLFLLFYPITVVWIVWKSPQSTYFHKNTYMSYLLSILL